MTEDGVDLLETRLVTLTRVLRARLMTLISPFTPGRESSGWATRSNEGLSCICEFALRDSMRAERDGVYEGMYKSEKYRGLEESLDGIGPMA